MDEITPQDWAKVPADIQRFTPESGHNFVHGVHDADEHSRVARRALEDDGTEFVLVRWPLSWVRPSAIVFRQRCVFWYQESRVASGC